MYKKYINEYKNGESQIILRSFKKLILISKEEFERLVKANLINFSKMEKNYAIVNAKKKSKRKKYFVVETKKILNFLGIRK